MMEYPGRDDATFAPGRTGQKKMQIDLAIGRHPQQAYRYLQSLCLSDIDFLPVVIRDAQGKLSAESLTGEVWGNFLSTVFDMWVREDIDRISVSLFDSTLSIWRGISSVAVAPDMAFAKCFCCEQRRFCMECRTINDPILCSGYRRFFTYSAPYMRVMRDLIKQHRSPGELMAMLS